jgi:hypothetical protein
MTSLLKTFNSKRMKRNYIILSFIFYPDFGRYYGAKSWKQMRILIVRYK